MDGFFTLFVSLTFLFVRWKWQKQLEPTAQFSWMSYRESCTSACYFTLTTCIFHGLIGSIWWWCKSILLMHLDCKGVHVWFISSRCLQEGNVEPDANVTKENKYVKVKLSISLHLSDLIPLVLISTSLFKILFLFFRAAILMGVLYQLFLFLHPAWRAGLWLNRTLNQAGGSVFCRLLQVEAALVSDFSVSII